jgi:two-component sensor histidine kinase
VLAEKQKDILMQELNHRVKNNLLMITSLIKLKNNAVGGSVDLSDLIHQIDTIRIVHEKLYKSSDVTRISMDEYIPDLFSTVFSFSPLRIKAEVQCENVVLPTSTAVPLGLLINEIATNAIKHGFYPEKEAVFTAELHGSEERETADSQELVLMLSNNGKPFPDDIDLDNPQTLGMRLISALVDQLNGKLELQREPHPVFTIRFPIQAE